ncbi:MAG TPA: hypothetical protein VGQ78_11120 [Vicinamibacteria bacterium]|nr:hypothetical protein [Vicinamibacteria bacterium]
MDRGAALLLLLWILLLEAWFQGPLLGRWLGRRSALVLAALVLGVVAARAAMALRRRRPDRRFIALVASVLALATLVRWPALKAPASLISSDSAVAGIIAQELRAAEWPPPIYAPGFPYEGTLKPHLTALLALLFPGAGTAPLYAVASHLFYLVWTAAVMALARDAGGDVAAAVAGAFMAVSPRFLTAFSLNNVGQYPDVCALGTLALALLSAGSPLAWPMFLAGLAVWQQLVGLYFLLTLVVAALLTPALRTPRSLATGTAGFLAGSYPMWIWNATHGWATFDFLRRGGRHPADRVSGLPERLAATVGTSFPKMFGLTDAGLPAALGAVLGLLLPALVLWLVWAKRDEIRRRRGRSAALLAGLLLLVSVGTFALSKFSHRGAQRPRYLLPVYASVAVAGGAAAAAAARRSLLAAVVPVAAVLAVNAIGLRPWLLGRAPAEAHDRAIVDALVRLGVRTGYGGFWVAPKYTFLGDGRFVLSAELGPDVSWVHAGHAALVRTMGPDAYVVDDPALAAAFAARLDAMHVRYDRTDVDNTAIFHHFARRVALEDVEGYERQATGPRTPPPAEEVTQEQ